MTPLFDDMKVSPAPAEPPFGGDGGLPRIPDLEKYSLFLLCRSSDRSEFETPLPFGFSQTESKKNIPSSVIESALNWKNGFPNFTHSQLEKYLVSQINPFFLLPPPQSAAFRLPTLPSLKIGQEKSSLFLERAPLPPKNRFPISKESTHEPPRISHLPHKKMIFPPACAHHLPQPYWPFLPPHLCIRFVRSRFRCFL